MKSIKIVRIFLLVLIIIGLGLLITQKLWVPKLIDKILKHKSSPAIFQPVTNDSLEVITNKTSFPEIKIPQSTTFTPVRTSPVEISPYKTTQQTSEYESYIMTKVSELVPTFYYDHDGNKFKIVVTPVGEDRAGRIYNNADIQVSNKSDETYKSIGTFDINKDNNPKVYTHGSDIIFVSENYWRSGCCETIHNQEVIIYNPILNKTQLKKVTYNEDAPIFLLKSFSLFIQNDKLYLKSDNEYGYLPDSIKKIYASQVDGFGVPAYYLLQDGQIINNSKDFRNNYLREAEKFNEILNKKSRTVRLPMSLLNVNINISGSPDSLALGVASNSEVLMSDNSSKKITDVVVGDKVMSYEIDTGKIVPASVAGIVKRSSETVTLNNEVTVGHWDLLPSRQKLQYSTSSFYYRWAYDIYYNAQVIKKNDYVSVKITGSDKNQTIYNLVLSSPHMNFFANDYVVISEPPSVTDWFSPLIGRTLNLLAAGETENLWNGFSATFSWELSNVDTLSWDKNLPLAKDIREDLQILFK